jgi:hypothetical protein
VPKREIAMPILMNLNVSAILEKIQEMLDLPLNREFLTLESFENEHSIDINQNATGAYLGIRSSIITAIPL